MVGLHGLHTVLPCISCHHFKPVGNGFAWFGERWASAEGLSVSEHLFLKFLDSIWPEEQIVGEAKSFLRRFHPELLAYFLAYLLAFAVEELHADGIAAVFGSLATLQAPGGEFLVPKNVQAWKLSAWHTTGGCIAANNRAADLICTASKARYPNAG